MGRERTQQLLDVLAGVGDGGAGDDELRGAPILALAHAPQPAQHQRGMAAEHAPIRVPLVHHHVAQVGQEAPKLAVHGQHAAVEHVGVGDQQVRPVPDLRPIILRTQTTALDPGVPVCPAWVASSAVCACLSLQDERHATCMTPQCLCAMHSSPRQNPIRSVLQHRSGIWLCRQSLTLAVSPS